MKTNNAKKKNCKISKKKEEKIFPSKVTWPQKKFVNLLIVTIQELVKFVNSPHNTNGKQIHKAPLCTRIATKKNVPKNGQLKIL